MLHFTTEQLRHHSSTCCCQYLLLIPVLVILMLTARFSTAQVAENAGKFLGNITTNNQIRTDFSAYWNHITGENECQWLTVESRRDVMNWSGFDQIAKFAREKKIPWRFHALLTSGTYPGWMTTIPDSTLLKEIAQWMDAAALRYPDVPMIDVIDEGGTHFFPAIIKKALGGDGVTGFDWAIKAFTMARERWPKALLIYNDYNNIEEESQIKSTLNLITALKQAHAPVDMIGCEANYTQNIPTSNVKTNIDRIAETGLPVYISAFEVGKSSDALQDSIVREQFTMFWNHPKVIGITYWGYVLGQTWRENTGLLTSGGVERPALVWLKTFVKNNPNPPNDFPNLLNHTTNINHPRIPAHSRIRANQTIESNGYRVFDLQGRYTTGHIGNPGMNCSQNQQRSSGMFMILKDGNTGIADDFKGVIEIK